MKPVGQTINSKGFEVVAAGKEGAAYVLDPTQMGTGLQAADNNDPCTTGESQPVQCFQPITLKIISGTVQDGSGSRVPPAFWGGDANKSITENFLYAAGSLDTELRYWQMDPVVKNGTFNTTIYATGLPPTHGTGTSFPYPGGSTLVTWNDTVQNPTAGDAILWAVDFSGYLSAMPAILLAYPALVAPGTQNQTTLKSDSTDGPIANKFTLPTVVNGQVYVGGQGSSTQCTIAGFGTNCGMLARWSQ